MIATLPERAALARQRKMSYEDFLLQVLSDEVTRRDQLCADSRARKGHPDPEKVLEAGDDTAKVTYDRDLGPVGVGKTFAAPSWSRPIASPRSGWP